MVCFFVDDGEQFTLDAVMAALREHRCNSGFDGGQRRLELVRQGIQQRSLELRVLTDSLSAIRDLLRPSTFKRNCRQLSDRRGVLGWSGRLGTLADRWLAVTAVTRNTNRATQFCGSAIVNVPTGGRKNRL